MVLETERLYLREMNPEDAESFYLLNLDPEVVKYTGDKPFENAEEARQFLKNYDQYKKYGFGRWAVIRKEDGAFLGWCGLKYTPALGEVDVGFRLFRKYWNQGYATESARACVEWGLDQPEVDEIIGRAMKENTASIRVLEKIGMTFHGEFDFERHPGLLYKIERPQI
ncbi:MAG: GNAT family N-acetyltransferase [Bacteroidales bacterium]|nr:GNAT family N-acetyltransferase [Bacteroidales bacterium]